MALITKDVSMVVDLGAKDNGGTTGYFDLPLPNRELIVKAIESIDFSSIDLSMDIVKTVNYIILLCPQTLNDLIEYKNMQPWQHEVFKACYALEERAIRATDGSSSRLREINKMEYYVGRGKNLELSKK